ncbi:hypothetical protein [Halomonas sp.]|uniref:hypothetical protein n=1 Tax=Halomonas sp. TaxID=1486246 RepID=UPI003D0C49FC
MTIDPEKLLELARNRQGPAGVTLSWPTVVKIVEELRGLNALRESYGNRELELFLLEREHGGTDYCDACLMFTPWKGPSEVPEDYNPCSLGHPMHFHIHEHDPHAGGYYRLICSDRELEVEE